jgi:MFS family permease
VRASEPAGAPSRSGILDILRIPEIRAILIGTFAIMLGFGILYPILPLYARSFGVGYRDIGLLAAAFGFTRLAFDLVAGRFIARFGERAMATWGAIVVGVSSALAAMAPTFNLLVLFRGIGGAGSSLFFAAALAYLLKTVDKPVMGRVMGVYYGVFNLGFIAGPPIGGLAAGLFGPASALWIYAGSCLIAGWLYWHFLRDPETGGVQEHRSLRAIRWNRAFIATLGANLAQAWFIGSVYNVLVPMYGKDLLGMSALGIGVAIAINSAAETLSLYPAGRISDRIGRKPLLLPSLAISVLVLVLFGHIGSSTAFVVGLVAFGLVAGVGSVAPAAMLSDLSSPENAAVAAGVFRFVFDFGMAFSPFAAGAAADALGLGSAFALTAIAPALAFLLLLTSRETLGERRPARSGEVGL